MPARRKPIAHGTPSGYRRGCREECCRVAHREYMRQYREGHRDRINELSRSSARRVRKQARIDAGLPPARSASPPPRETPKDRRDRLIDEELEAIRAQRPAFPWE